MPSDAPYLTGNPTKAGGGTGYESRVYGWEAKVWGDIKEIQEAQEDIVRQANHGLYRLVREARGAAGPDPKIRLASLKRLIPPDPLAQQLGLPDHASRQCPVPRLAVFETAEEAREIWESQPADWVRRQWSQTIYSLLLKGDLARACTFLHVSIAVSHPPLSYVTAATRFVMKSLGTLELETRTAVSAALVQAIESVLVGSPRPGRSKERPVWALSRSHFYELLLTLDTGQVVSLARAVVQSDIGLAGAAVAMLANKVAKLAPDQSKFALDLLEMAMMGLGHHKGDSVDEDSSSAMQKVLTGILTSVQTQGEGAVSADDLLSFSARTGVRLNEMHATCFLDKLSRQTDDAWALWGVFEKFVCYGIDGGDQGMLRVLLRTAKKSMDDKFILHTLSMVARGLNRNLPQSKYIAATAFKNDILHALFLVSLTSRPTIYDSKQDIFRKAGAKWSYKAMVRLYSVMFDKKPLLDLIPPFFESFLSPDPGDKLITTKPGVSETLQEFSDLDLVGRFKQASPTTLHIMLVSYILSVPVDLRGAVILALYGHFRSLVAAGHPAALSLFYNNQMRVFDSLILALGDTVRDTHASLEIIGDLLLDARDEGQRAADATNVPGHDEAAVTPSTATMLDADATVHIERRRPRPNKWTWNIVLDLCLRRVGPESVGRVLNLMRSHGIEPNLVTWNTIIVRAAEQGNTRLAAQAARKIHESCFEPTVNTMSAFAAVHDKEEFLRLMRDLPDEEVGEGGGDGDGSRSAREMTKVEADIRKEEELRATDLTGRQGTGAGEVSSSSSRDECRLDL